MNYRSFAFTIRPRNGVNDKLLEDAISWIQKQDYGFMVTEMALEAKHIHGQIWINNPRAKGTVALSLERLQERSDPEWDPASKKVLRRGVRIAYNKDFVEEYLSEDKTGSTIEYNNPPEDEDEFYPSQEEQDAVMNEAHAADKRLHRLSLMYHIYYKEDMPILAYKKLVAKFLFDAWYISKNLPTLQSKRYEKDLLRKLVFYLYPSPDGWEELLE